MLAKLAFRNVRRSVRDYAIYFVTLVFGVAVFYAFNSVTGQSILFDLEDTATASVFEMTGQMLGMFSVVIACVLGFLVLYANGFLIRRRKQEFGTYLMLGMNPSSVSVIVLLETVAVGLVSLGVGLALGFALSQGLSFVTAGLFNRQMEQYRFVFSTNAFLLTLGCFVLIFAVTGLFNTLSIRRYKLIDLLSARSKNARFRVRNPWISLVGFLAAVAVIAWSYVTLVDNGLMQFDEGFWRATARMVAGTFLFFWSLAGFALAAIERTRGIYFKGLAKFTTRQIASKVNTAVRRHAHGERVPQRGRHPRRRGAREHERGGSGVSASRRREGRRHRCGRRGVRLGYRREAGGRFADVGRAGGSLGAGRRVRGRR